MPNYNQTLQTNNSSLEEIITQLNNLPNAPETVAQATPAITVNQTTGLITATATQIAGYVPAGTKSATHQLAFQPAQTITPGTTDKTIAANTYLGGVQTIKGDANLVASNIVSGKSIFGVVGTASVGGGGDTSVEDGLVTGTLTTYSNDRVKTIRDRAFYDCTSLTSVSFPAATAINIYAFNSCTSLTSVSFPAATYIGDYAFNACKSLTSVSFPAATTIRDGAFYSCKSLTSVSFPAATTIGDRAFYSCPSLTSVSFPVCTSIGGSAFTYCVNLTSVSFPAATTIGSHAFRSCASLTSVSLPAATTIGSSAFYSCPSLTSVSFPAAKTIGTSAFYSCKSLSIIYLGASSVCKLNASQAFMNTGIGSFKGSIFVPASLLTSYKTATNWAFFKSRIFAYTFT